MRLNDLFEAINFNSFETNIRLAKEGYILYRGRRKKTDRPEIFDTTVQYRKAANTGDFYKQMLDEANPDWPKRSYSLICTTSKDYANMYGNLHAVIPMDSLAIAAVNKPDMWRTDVQELNRYPYALKFLAVESSEQLNITNPDNQTEETWFRDMAIMKEHLYKIEDVQPVSNGLTLDPKFDKIISSWLLDKSKSVADLKKDLLNALDYRKLGCSLHQSLTQAYHAGAHGEMWFSGKCLLIPIHRLENFLKAF